MSDRQLLKAIHRQVNAAYRSIANGERERELSGHELRAMDCLIKAQGLLKKETAKATRSTK